MERFLLILLMLSLPIFGQNNKRFAFFNTPNQYTALNLNGTNEYCKYTPNGYFSLMGENLMTNSNFETYTGTQDNNLTATYTGWTDVNGTNSVQASANYDTLRGGENSLKLSGASVTGWVRQTITVVAGKSYALKFWIKGDGTNKGRYAIYDVSNSAYIQAIAQAGSATAWAEVSRMFTAPANCTSIQINFIVGSPASSIAYYDHAYLREIPNTVIIFRHSQTDTTYYKDREYLLDQYYGDYNRCWNFRTIGTNEGSPYTDFGKLSFGFGIDGSSSFATGLSTIAPLARNTQYTTLLKFGFNGTAIEYSMYLNGVLQSSATSNSAPFCDDTVTVYVGTVRNATTLLHFFNGTIGDIQIIKNYSPSASEIVYLANNPYKKYYDNVSQIIVYWQFNNFSTTATMLQDYSGNNFNLTGFNIDTTDLYFFDK